MRSGAVVLLDALGFKGIWGRHPGGAEAVLAKMKSLRTRILAMRGIGSPRTVVEVRCEVISDSIAIGAIADPNRRPPGEPVYRPLVYNALTLNAAASLAAGACSMGLLEEPHLAYRGCMTFGEFDMEEGFIIGPAVDEAAEKMEQAEGAFVWCAPSAFEWLDAWDAERAELTSRTLVRYQVPLKGGLTANTFAVVPWIPREDEATIKGTNEKLLATFNTPDPSVVNKRENTRTFLDAAFPTWFPSKP